MVEIKFYINGKELKFTEKDFEDGIKIHLLNLDVKIDKKYLLRLTPNKKGMVMN